MIFRRLVLASLGVLAIAAFAATAEARPGQGRGQRPQPSPAAESAPLFEPSEAVAPAPELAVETPEAPVDVATPDSATADATEPQNLPPGLQRQVDSGRGLPPGLQRQVDSGRGLPPGLQR